MTGQLGLLPPTANELRAEETDTAERSDDPTPRGVIRAVLEAAELVDAMPEEGRLHVRGAGFSTQGLMAEPVRVLDVCAGHGAWASEMRRLAQLQGWPVHITGVELHAPREPDLRKWCDEVVIRDWRELFDAFKHAEVGPTGALCFQPSQVDLVIGNPHFPALTGDGGPSMPETLLEHAPAVLLLHTQQAFLRGAAGRAAWRRCPPAACWLVPGAVGFRGPGEGTDARCYQVSLWLRGHEGPTSTHLLPELEAKDRRWLVPPGSEQPSADLPAAPGWTP